MSAQNYYADTPWTWRDRLGARLFPYRHCDLPEGVPSAFQDCLVCTTHVCLSWADRLRVVLTGHLVVQTKTVTEFTVGRSVTSSAAYPALPPSSETR